MELEKAWFKTGGFAGLSKVNYPWSIQKIQGKMEVLGFSRSFRAQMFDFHRILVKSIFRNFQNSHKIKNPRKSERNLKYAGLVHLGYGGKKSSIFRCWHFWHFWHFIFWKLFSKNCIQPIFFFSLKIFEFQKKKHFCFKKNFIGLIIFLLYLCSCRV